jgi:hypothetical protein
MLMERSINMTSKFAVRPAGLNTLKMNMRISITALFALLAMSTSLVAQTPCADTNASCSSVPRLIRSTGILVDSAGHPRTGTVGVTFSVYSQATGGTPLWQESQNVSLDQQGRYAVLLGMTKTEGMPVEVFSSPEPRWLGVWPQVEGEQEHSRVALVSVPYALKAADTETLQGLPASAFVRAPASASGQSTAAVAVSSPSAGAVASGASATQGSAKQPDSAVTTPGGTVNSLPKFGSATSIVNSQISDSNGMVGMQNLANILFADQFPNGVPDAVQACPAAGCVIYAYSPNTNLNLGTIDPGDKSVTLYLGPYTYNVTQITLRSSLKIIGMGARATALQSTNGNNPVFVLVQAVNGCAQHVLLSGFQIIGSKGNTSEDAIFLDSSGYFNAGMWYSELRDIFISGFAGTGVHIKGTNANFGGMTQFSEFDRVVVFRTKGGGNALRIEGAAYDLNFNDCEFDGSGAGDGINIFIGGRPGNSYAMPIDMNFRGLTSQGAATAVQVDGGWAISFDHSHHEFVWGVYLVTGDLGVGTVGLTISGAGFQDTGSNNGAGYLLNVATTLAFGIRFVHNHIMNPADAVVRAQNGANVVYQDNVFLGNTILPKTQGITMQVASAATINISGAHTVALSPSNTQITTIQATLGPGETVTFYTPDGPVVFGSGGNINLLGANTITVNGSITFVVTDLGGTPTWVPVSQWNPSSAAVMGFDLSISATSVTVTRGENANAKLTVTPQKGFSGIVSLTCVGEPSEISCSVLPNAVSVDGTKVNATLVVTPTLSEPTLQRITSAPPPSQGLLLALSSNAWAGLLLLPVTTSRSRLGTTRIAQLGCLLVLLVCTVGCGVSSFGPGISQPHQYHVVVTAKAGSSSRSVSFLVTVK